MTAFELLAEVGFEGDALLTAAAVGYGESEGFTDAVGDIELARLGPYSTQVAAVDGWAARKAAGKPVPAPSESVIRQETDGRWYVVNTKWGASGGWFQIRPLDEPAKWPFPDSLRYADKLRDARYAAQVAFEIWKKDGNFLKWSVFKSGKYKEFLGMDYELRTGHPRAGEWNV